MFVAGFFTVRPGRPESTGQLGSSAPAAPGFEICRTGDSERSHHAESLDIDTVI